MFHSSLKGIADDFVRVQMERQRFGDLSTDRQTSDLITSSCDRHGTNDLFYNYYMYRTVRTVHISERRRAFLALVGVMKTAEDSGQ